MVDEQEKNNSIEALPVALAMNKQLQDRVEWLEFEWRECIQAKDQAEATLEASLKENRNLMDYIKTLTARVAELETSEESNLHKRPPSFIGKNLLATLQE